VLASQVKASQERLAKLQEQLRVKKQANIGRLPDQMNANVAMVNGLRQQHESLSLQFRTEQDRLAMIEGQLEQMKQGAGGILTSSAQSALQGAQARVNDLERQLRQYQANGYTEQHPDIIATKEALTIARRELTTVRQQSPDGGGGDLLAADPAYRQKVSERDAARLRVATLQRQMSQALQQIAAYQSRVDSAPLVEQELASLVQEESLERKRYESLSDQYQRAQVAEDVTRKQGGERFVVLNPAYLPTRPTSPDLLRLMAMAIALGLVLGVAAVIGREFLDRSVHDARVLQNEFEVPVLGEIPRIHA
jgi:murein L,D-transpeptidase YcbB/YkuD